MNPNKRNYKATFILDNRGKEDSVDQLIEGVKKEIAAVQGEVSAVENFGRRDFARKTDDKFPSGVYVQVNFAAPGDAPAQLRERLRLNDSVYRALVESA
jgi:small subunit ribosomal protein S6